MDVIVDGGSRPSPDRPDTAVEGAHKLTDSTTTDPKAGHPFGRDTADVQIVPVAPENRAPQQRRLLEPVRGDDAANVFATLVSASTHYAYFHDSRPRAASGNRCREPRQSVAHHVSLVRS
jgi:hypothetical protein